MAGGLRLSVAVLVLLLSSIPIAGARAARIQNGPTLDVLVGWGDPTVAIEEFFPKTIRVAVGTTVTWTQGSLREHTVTFLAGERIPPQSIPQPEDPSLPEMRNPKAQFATLPGGSFDGSYFINSGVLEVGETFSVTFGHVGSYELICIPHFVREGMAATVEVVPLGSEGITTQAEVNEEIAAETARFQSQIDEMLANRSSLVTTDRPDGGKLAFVRVGTDWRSEPDLRIGRLTLRAFLPDQVTVRAGDTVVWYTDTRVPVHTVTFGVQTEPPPARWTPRLADGALAPLDLLEPTGVYRGAPDSLDWPRIIENPAVVERSVPSTIYDPTKYFNSGQLGDTNPDVGRAFSLTFNTPGTFTYICIPHASIGMVGQVRVLPQ